LINKATKCKNGAIVAMVAKTKADTIIAITEKITLKQRNLVTEIILNVVGNSGLLAKKCFPNATHITDCFHFQKLTTDALHKIRIKYHWQAIDQQNEAIEKAKKSKKRFEPEVLKNGDTLKQLLARSHYFLYKTKSKWTENQIERAIILFELDTDIQKAYSLTENLRTIS